MPLKIEVDTTEAQSAITVFEHLAKAADMAREALEKLDGQAHGGISVQIAGPLAVCNVLPTSQAGTETINYIKNNMGRWIRELKTDGVIS